MFRFNILDQNVSLSAEDLYMNLDYDNAQDIIAYLQIGFDCEREWVVKELLTALRTWLQEREEDLLDESK